MLRLRLGQRLRRDAQQPRQRLALVDQVGHLEMRFRARIRRPHRGVRPEQRAAGVGRLDEELVVADQRDDLGVQVERVLAEHLAVGEGAEAVELVGEVVDEGAVGGHGRIRALAAVGVKRMRKSFSSMQAHPALTPCRRFGLHAARQTNKYTKSQCGKKTAEKEFSKRHHHGHQAKADRCVKNMQPSLHGLAGACFPPKPIHDF